VAVGVIKGDVQTFARLLNNTFSDSFLVFSSTIFSDNLILAVIIHP
jgi:hypothetical protein